MATKKQTVKTEPINYEKQWLDKVKKMLVGRTIVDAQYLDADNAEEMGWSRRPILLVLDDGNVIYPSSDDEGNDGGSLLTENADLPCVPSFRC